MTTPVSLRQCWADRPSAYGSMRQCKATVLPDVDHIGLCDECRARLRGAADHAARLMREEPDHPLVQAARERVRQRRVARSADEVVRDMREDAIDSILYGEAG